MLPDDLTEFLSSSERSWKLDGGEVREITLCTAADVLLKRFDIDSYDFYLNGPLTADPEERFEYDGYDLVQNCSSYAPEGILVWFPEWNEYGSWDCDHHVIHTYPGVTWSQIVSAPTWYVNGQWYPDKVRWILRLNPWAEYVNEDRCRILISKANKAMKADPAEGLRLARIAASLKNASEEVHEVAKILVERGLRGSHG
jgi:hypothetical protein